MGNNRSNVSLGLFSVLIANYNNGQYLKEAIQSVYNQTYTNWEIIIVDDASTDCSKEIYQEIQSDSRIHIYFNEKNEGCGYTKRKCVELARGEFCGFLDPDDALMDSALSDMIVQHIAYKNASLIFSLLYFCDADLKPLSVNQLNFETGYITADFLHRECIISHFVTFKREIYFQTVGISPILKRAVDQDLYLKLEEVGGKVFINKPLYLYRNHEKSISLGDNESKAMFWHVLVLKNACDRRHIPEEAEDIIGSLLSSFSNKEKLFKMRKQIEAPSLKIVVKLFILWIKQILVKVR